MSNSRRVAAFQADGRLGRAANRARFAFLAALAITAAVFFVGTPSQVSFAGPLPKINWGGPGVTLGVKFADTEGLRLSSDTAK